MIVDGKGNLFEDRRKVKEDRRKTTIDATGGRRQGERRKSTPENKKSK